MFLEFHDVEKESNSTIGTQDICIGCENACWLRCTDNCEALCRVSCMTTARRV